MAPHLHPFSVRRICRRESTRLLWPKEASRAEAVSGRCAQILVIAVLMKWVLARSFSVFQWEALLLLVAGITVNQLNYCKCAPAAFTPASAFLSRRSLSCSPHVSPSFVCQNQMKVLPACACRVKRCNLVRMHG